MTNANNGFDSDAFSRLLDKIKEDQLPDYGSIHYDGQKRQIREEILLCRPDEDPRIAKKRALRYLEALTQEEREAADIEVETRNRQPFRLIVKAGTSELPPDRLEELKQRINP